MEITPFQGWRYAADELSRLIAPPYDILSQADKDALLAGDAHNIVAVDLPHCPPSGAGPDATYVAAADTLRRWVESGLLQRDDRPSLYAYEQSFTRAGRNCRRRALIAAVRLAGFGQGVWPHEKTFAGPKADRLKLTCATGMQLSPIFGFYEDDGTAARLLFDAAGPVPTQTGTLGGVQEGLWAVSDEKVLSAVCSALNDRPLFIADGHHRYTTALNYRQGLGEPPPDHPANFVMFVLVGLADPGLVILPTHRVISGLDEFELEGFVNSTRRVLDWQETPLSPENVADADGFLRLYGPHAMAFAGKGGLGQAQPAYVGRLKDAGLMKKIAPDQTHAWRELDVAILHRLILERFMADCRTQRTTIEYFSDGPKALASVASGTGDLAVFLQATPLSAVKDIALSGAVMPHKSTYFWPKPATGLVLYSLR